MRTYIALILDKSSSMESVRDETIQGVNEQIRSIKRAAEINGNTNETLVSLVTFSYRDYIDTVFWNKPANELREITKDDYYPNGMTAMLDAMGYVMDRYSKDTNVFSSENRYLLIVLTDGLENDSQKENWKTMADRIAFFKKSDRWTVTLQGANVDIDKMASQMNLEKGNVRAYQSTVLGTRDAFASMRGATMSYVASAAAASTSFYAGDTDGDNLKVNKDDTSGK